MPHRAPTPFLTFVAHIVLGWIVVVNGLPVVGGVYYCLCGEHRTEQEWLDRAVEHLKVLKTRTSDPDLQNVLDYAIRRYSKIGPWDVMVAPCPSTPGDKTVGANWPFCPGIMLDPETLTYPIHDGSLVLVHESLHDYWPWFGHAHVTPRMEKLERLRW